MNFFTENHLKDVRFLLTIINKYNNIYIISITIVTMTNKNVLIDGDLHKEFKILASERDSSIKDELGKLIRKEIDDILSRELEGDEKRKSVRIHEATHTELKKLAVDRKTTMKVLINDLIRDTITLEGIREAVLSRQYIGACPSCGMSLYSEDNELSFGGDDE